MQILAVFLGQAIALLCASTGVFTSLLLRTGVSLPFTQAFSNYLLLAIFHGIPQIVIAGKRLGKKGNGTPQGNETEGGSGARVNDTSPLLPVEAGNGGAQRNALLESGPSGSRPCGMGPHRKTGEADESITVGIASTTTAADSEVEVEVTDPINSNDTDIEVEVIGGAPRGEKLSSWVERVRDGHPTASLAFVAMCDSLASCLAVWAYEYTTVTSAMLLGSFSVPCVMALSFLFLSRRYGRPQLLGVLLCLGGVAALVVSDAGSGSDAGIGGNKGNGDDDANGGANGVYANGVYANGVYPNGHASHASYASYASYASQAGKGTGETGYVVAGYKSGHGRGPQGGSLVGVGSRLPPFDDKGPRVDWARAKPIGSSSFVAARDHRVDTLGTTGTLHSTGTVSAEYPSRNIAIMSSGSSNGTGKGTESWRVRVGGDLLVLGSALLYAVSNVAEELFVKARSPREFLGWLGIFGSLFSGVIAAAAEGKYIAAQSWSPEGAVYFTGFALALFSQYSLGPVLITRASATLYTLSLLTTSAYAILAGVVIFHYAMSPWYFVSLALVVAGVGLFSWGEGS